MKNKSMTMAAVFATLFLFSSATLAAGTFKQYLAAKTDFQTSDWAGGKVTIGTIKGVVETSGSTGNGMPNGTSVQFCMVRSLRVNDSIDLVANCSFTDKDGDILYAIAERKQGDVSAGSGGKGRTRFVGGTGKYNGATGGCDYLTRYLPDSWSIVQSDCSRD